MTEKPKITDAPGLVWRPRRNGWAAYWVAQANMVERGYEPRLVSLWTGSSLTDMDQAMIRQRCTQLQGEMIVWGAGLAPPPKFDGTLRALINCYQTDADSTYKNLRYHVRVRHDQMLRRIYAAHGDTRLEDIKTRLIYAWHRQWTQDGKRVAIGHFFVAELRTLFRFGMTLLEDKECTRLAAVMAELRFESPKPRTERMTAEQAVAIRTACHAREWHSLALGQAFQFDLMLRQKDVIGEWVPESEPGDVAYRHQGRKWARGLLWQEIDKNFTLRHVTSKRGKPLEVNLRLAPMVMEELALMAGVGTADITRDMLPDMGPVLICEHTKRPWLTAEYRRKWRMMADKAGVPKAVKNMDSRAGGISEATDAGADLEMVRHAATHSNINMTQRYSRGSAEKIETVMELRAKHRNKPKTD